MDSLQAYKKAVQGGYETHSLFKPIMAVSGKQ